MKYHVSFDISLKRNTGPGKYFVIEGLDGSGKTTQVRRLKQYFESQGKPAVATKEPTREGPLGELIHKILSKKISTPAVANQYLWAADRVVHLKEVVIPALEKGQIVVSDRCFWSAIPYGLSDKNKIEPAEVELVVQSMLSMYHQFIVPDKTFYLDVSVDTAMQRIGSKKNSGEIYEERGKLEKIKNGYEWLLEKFPQEFVRIDAEKTEGEVAEQIVASIK